MILYTTHYILYTIYYILYTIYIHSLHTYTHSILHTLTWLSWPSPQRAQGGPYLWSLVVAYQGEKIWFGVFPYDLPSKVLLLACAGNRIVGSNFGYYVGKREME